ncbi:MAG: hypothetical protein ACREKN_04980 [Longimicrobiaceae bacterium]
MSAENRLERALGESGGRDPRDYYRELLKDLKQKDPGAYHEACAYYRDRLTPAVARDDSDPLGEWLEYGRRLAGLLAPGRTVLIDRDGRAANYTATPPRDRMVLHLPEQAGEPALLVGLPPEPSPAQLATYRLLVKRAQR